MDRMSSSHGMKGLLAVWRRRRRLALLIFTPPFTIIASMAMSLPDMYQATARVLVGRQQVSETFVRSAVTGELETRLRTISQEILSRARLQALIARFHLYPELSVRSSMEEVIERMRRDIQMQELKEIQQTGTRATIAFTLSYRSKDPQLAATVANALASMYIEENLKIRETQARGTAEFLRVQLEEMKRRLDEEERRVGQFKQRHSGELPEQQQANLATLERLNTELRLNSENQMRVRERLEREELTRQLAEANPYGLLGDPAKPLAGPEAVAARLERLTQELTELRTRFYDNYPEVVRVKAEIAALERALSDKKSEQSSGAKPAAPPNPPVPRPKKFRSDAELELKALQEQEKALREAIAGYQRRIEIAPHREQEFQELSRNYKTTKEQYNTLLQRYQEALVAESMEQDRKGEQFRMLDPAIPPKEPAGPNRLKLMLAGLIVSLLSAAGATVLAEQLDDSLHTIEDVRAFTKIPVLARIPRIVTAREVWRARWRAALGIVAALAGLALMITMSHYLAHDNDGLVLMLMRSHS